MHGFLGSASLYQRRVVTKRGKDEIVSADGLDGPTKARTENVRVDVVGKTLEVFVLEGGFGEESVVEIGATHRSLAFHFDRGETQLRKGAEEGHEMFPVDN